MEQLSPADLTPKHVRAARALLAWSQQDLAKAANVATSTVADFERGSRTPVANNAQAIRTALETAGIHFLPTGAVIGSATPAFPKAGKPGTPVRWVNSDDFAYWAGMNDGPVSLPTLITFLVRAAHGGGVRLRFPSDGGVRHSGWDGITDADSSSEYVPKGRTGWELSAQRQGVPQKIAKDYAKRTDAPAPFNPASSACIFVTLQHWPEKDAWAQTQMAAGPWREVRVYDADDLVHWIEQTPAVGLWLAHRLGKRLEGIRELDQVWEEWSLATRWPLTEDLVLADRDQSAAEVLRWLRGDPAVLSLQATTTDEIVAFFHATLRELPEDIADGYRARCLVATTEAAARGLANAPAPLYLILTEPNPGLARSLAGKGHFVLQAYDERLAPNGEIRGLERPSREGIAVALRAAGFSEPRARALARDCARNLTVLRRLIPEAPGQLPEWAQKPPRALLAALLAGGWDENSEADKARLSELADMPYGQLISDLTTSVGAFDSPLQKIGPTWRVASPYDAWVRLAHHLTAVDIKRFEAAALAVHGSAVPRFEMYPNERWMAAVKGVTRDYSGMLRHGIGQVLILLALWGGEILTVQDADRRADAIVSKLLAKADQERWWSLTRDFRLLAEASPNAFLSAIEDSLDQNDPPILALFGHDEGGVFGAEYLSDLMWALESLAWSPDLLPRVTVILARLDAIDTRPRRYVNGPANSLREMHLLWIPQTYATLDDRLHALDLIRRSETNAAWKLMLGILPSGHDTATPSPMPRWRDFTPDVEEPITWGLLGRGAAEITHRLLQDVETNIDRWILLLDRLGDLAPGPDTALEALKAIEPQIIVNSDRDRIWDRLRGILHHNRQVPDADWRLPDPVLERIDAIYDRFSPSDPIERIAWLFKSGVQLPNPSTEGWGANQRDVTAEQIRVARDLFRNGGMDAVLALARIAETPAYLGKAIYDAGLPEADVNALLETALQSVEPLERDVANGLIPSMFHNLGEAWGEALLAKARAQAWSDQALLTILQALPANRWTWEQVADIGGEIATIYWRRTPVFWMSEDIDSVIYAVDHLIVASRARYALSLVHRAKAELPTELVVQVLMEAARQPLDDNGDANEPTMFQYYAAEIFALLDERDDIDLDSLARLEWNYLQLLEHSRRPPKALLRALSEQPKLFIDLLCAIFKPSAESGIVDPEPENPDQARTFAHQAYRLLSQWNRVPGKFDEPSTDGKALGLWIKDTRSLADQVGRLRVADSKIGEMLSASPIGADGNWPAEPVRDVLDLFRSKDMLSGFQIGKSNRRGMTTRMPRDGGQQERMLSAQYRAWAKAIRFDHPETSSALDGLAERYNWDAKRLDDDAARIDWED